jgi:hypothetical protein
MWFRTKKLTIPAKSECPGLRRILAAVRATDTSYAAGKSPFADSRAAPRGWGGDELNPTPTAFTS